MSTFELWWYLKFSKRTFSIFCNIYLSLMQTKLQNCQCSSLYYRTFQFPITSLKNQSTLTAFSPSVAKFFPILVLQCTPFPNNLQCKAQAFQQHRTKLKLRNAHLTHRFRNGLGGHIPYSKNKFKKKRSTRKANNSHSWNLQQRARETR